MPKQKKMKTFFLSYSTNKGLKYLLPDPHDNMIASAKLFNKNKKSFIYCVWTLTVSEWLTLLLLHPEEQNQAAEEKQGTHDHSWGQESLLLGAKCTREIITFKQSMLFCLQSLEA